MSSHMKKPSISLLLFTAILSIGMISVNQVFGQKSSSTDATGKVHTSYKASYTKVNADLHNSLTVETNHHLYKPGENVVVEGDVSSQLSTAVSGANVISIQPSIAVAISSAIRPLKQIATAATALHLHCQVMQSKGHTQ